LVTGEGSILLLFDGARCQLTAPLLKWAKEQNVVFFPLPAHRARLIEESKEKDSICFQAFRKCWDEAFQEFASQFASTCLSQKDLCTLMCRAYGEAMGVGGVVQFFRETGVYPFNPKGVMSVRRGNAVKTVIMSFNS
jgi:hypothetical protein